jgi:hypothetical protein
MKALLLLAVLGQTSAPSLQLPRADAHVAVGWQNLHKEQPTEHYNDWLNAILYGGAGAGWYWTDHLKTQVDVGAGTHAEQYQIRTLPVGGSVAYEYARVSFHEANVSIGQQYQFFRNQWFHPHVGAGLELARETSTAEYQPITVFDNLTRTTRQIAPARNEGPAHRFLARPFADTGFKAYMTRRAFFGGDMRLMFRGGVEEVLFRAGFGVDF